MLAVQLKDVIAPSVVARSLGPGDISLDRLDCQAAYLDTTGDLNVQLVRDMMLYWHDEWLDSQLVLRDLRAVPGATE